MVWRCCRCSSYVYTTGTLEVIKCLPYKRETCIQHHATQSGETPKTAPRFVRTTRDKAALVFDNNIYYCHYNTWRCSKRTSHSCKSVCKIEENRVVSNNEPHSHEALSEEEITLFDAVHDAKQQAIERPEDKPAHVISAAINSNFGSNPKGLNMEHLNKMRRAIYRKRRTKFKSIPKQRQMCIKQLKDMSNKEDETVRAVKGNIVMIARKEDLKLLDVDCLELFGDGTFKYSPRFFNQMYTFFVIKNGFYLPVAHFLLVNKTKATYKKMFELFTDECTKVGIPLKDKLHGGTIMLDFEKAVISCINTLFEKCKVKLCRFHLGQSWYRNITKHGLASLYKTADSQEGMWLRGLFGLPLLPQMMVQRAFQQYTRTASGRAVKLKAFQEYFSINYIQKCAQYPPALWADLLGTATNNGAESFHRNFGDMFGYLKCKPSIWYFLSNMAFYNVSKALKTKSYKQVKCPSSDHYMLVRSYHGNEINFTSLLRQIFMKNHA